MHPVHISINIKIFQGFAIVIKLINKARTKLIKI